MQTGCLALCVPLQDVAAGSIVARQMYMGQATLATLEAAQLKSLAVRSNIGRVSACPHTCATDRVRRLPATH